MTEKLLKLVLQQHSLLKKVGDTMTGRLIIPKDSYPVQGDLNKVINQGGGIEAKPGTETRCSQLAKRSSQNVDSSVSDNTPFAVH